MTTRFEAFGFEFKTRSSQPLGTPTWEGRTSTSAWWGLSNSHVAHPASEGRSMAWRVPDTKHKHQNAKNVESDVAEIGFKYLA